MLAPEADVGVKIWCKVEIEKVERCVAFLRDIISKSGGDVDPGFVAEVKTLEEKLEEVRFEYRHLWMP